VDTADRFVIGFVALLAVWTLVVLPFLYWPELPRDQQQHPSATPRSANYEPKGTPQAPFFIEVLPGPDAAQKAAQEAEDRLEKQSLERRLANWTVVLAIATIGLIGATGILGFFGFRQMRDTREMIRLGRDEFQSTHRPRIRIKHVWIAQKLLPNMPVAVDILLVNVGNVPAVIGNVGLDFNVINPELGMLPGNLEPPTVPTDAIGRICGLGFTIRINGISSRAPLDEARVDAIEQGRSTLCCFGAVEYFDTGPQETRRIRRTSFYRVFKPFPQASDGIGRFVISQNPDPDYEYED
jgi:hypothetical protein